MQRATLGFVPMSIGSRLVGGTLLGIVWTLWAVIPVVRAVESDVPDTVLLGVMFLAAIMPALLAGRRHAMAATIAWDERAITHLLSGRVKTAIAWKDATIRRGGGGPAPRVLQITDSDGRCISLVEGHGLTPAWLHGRRVISPHEARELWSLAERLDLPIVDGVVRESSDGPPIWRDAWRVVPLALAFVNHFVTYSIAAEGPAVTTLLLCFALLVVPVRRAARATVRKRGAEWIAFDGEELGLVHARRIDGGRVLVDLALARHPDALVASRRGFASATLRERLERPSSPYRGKARVLDAVQIETQSDRVLRFERLRTSFVDLFAYGGLFAMSLAAVLVS